MNTRAIRKSLDLRRIYAAVPRHLYDRARLEAIRRGVSVQQVLSDLLEQIPEHVIVRKSARERESRVGE